MVATEKFYFTGRRADAEKGNRCLKKSSVPLLVGGGLYLNHLERFLAAIAHLRSGGLFRYLRASAIQLVSYYNETNASFALSNRTSSHSYAHRPMGDEAELA
jgi:hypothetical protein